MAQDCNDKLLPESKRPEVYFLLPTNHVPNSPLPYLVYRGVVPPPYDADAVTGWVQAKQGWERKGPVWGPIYRRHFHPNVHECYAILEGSSTFVLGLGEEDTGIQPSLAGTEAQLQGMLLDVSPGDVVVQPAGTAHASIKHAGNFRYLSFFPAGAPQWQSIKSINDVANQRQKSLDLLIPNDPVIGGKGFLMPLWEDAKRQCLKTIPPQDVQQICRTAC